MFARQISFNLRSSPDELFLKKFYYYLYKIIGNYCAWWRIYSSGSIGRACTVSGRPGSAWHKRTYLQNVCNLFFRPYGTLTRTWPRNVCTDSNTRVAQLSTYLLLFSSQSGTGKLNLFFHRGVVMGEEANEWRIKIVFFSLLLEALFFKKQHVS